MFYFLRRSMASEPSARSAIDVGSGMPMIWPLISPPGKADECILTYQFSAMSCAALPAVMTFAPCL